MKINKFLFLFILRSKIYFYFYIQKKIISWHIFKNHPHHSHIKEKINDSFCKSLTIFFMSSHSTIFLQLFFSPHYSWDLSFANWDALLQHWLFPNNWKRWRDGGINATTFGTRRHCIVHPKFLLSYLRFLDRSLGYVVDVFNLFISLNSALLLLLWCCLLWLLINIIIIAICAHHLHNCESEIFLLVI